MKLPLIALAVAATAAFGQAPPAPPAPAPAPGAQTELPHQLVLGRRVAGFRSLTKVSNTVVIVSDAASYIEAVARWGPDKRFPVLIDDGTLLAHEDIARFVRAYQPTKVVRWAAEGARPGLAAEVEQSRLENAIARAWGIPAEHASQALLFELWKKVGFEPPGLVFMAHADPAWPAALALAAGRGQPIAMLRTKQGVDGTLTVDEADQLEGVIEQWAEATKLPWRAQGDAIEAITLCANVPAKIDTGKNGECFALTDRLGRVSTGLEGGPRWAYAGQVFGNHAQSAYRAMCSLFLATHKAWIFDGYPTSEPWAQWDGTKTGKYLDEIGIGAEVLDTPRQGSRDWRLRGARSVNAELIFVNTKGGSEYFDLEPGQCRPGEVPILGVPSAVHFVHSWSAQYPAARRTIAGRFMERGAFCYAGSVDEPFLQAFVPTPVVAGRLTSGSPFAPAVRTDDAKLWKVAVFGDPLYVPARAVPRYEDAVLEHTEEVTVNLRAMLTTGQFEQAAQALMLAGKDAEAAQLALTVLKERPDTVRPKLAAYGLMAAFRTGNNKGVVQLFGKLGPELSGDPVLRDYLWLAAYPLLDLSDDPLLRVLHDHVRVDQAGRDATTLASAWARRHGRASTDAMLAGLRKTLPKEAHGAFDEALKRPIAEWGN